MDYMLKSWWVRWEGGINVTLRLSFGTLRYKPASVTSYVSEI